MDYPPVPKGKQPRIPTDDEPTEMPGAYPQTSQIQWPDVRYASGPPPEQPAPRAAGDPAVERLLEWGAGIDRSIVEINRKLDFLLLETKDFRGMEAHYRALLREQTSAGTALPNACRRLDAHRQSLLQTVQRLDGTVNQIEGLALDIERLREGSEVTVSIKPRRKSAPPPPRHTHHDLAPEM
ncbi:uncharacterized protein GLRG_11154 [Colletotrichum graminicola M1.001]|uniref:Uncharacterized protein n=1 Tax=Colletotrichum graminicola (strain M1.001 / M2 / FGSC 10212) TaxID=645133 RepID=E3QYS2_COLGM|nr:uncharacterized protein GLRG_11154 [Colletotrichum graminicola M1.001]EFQ36010.1 hypothetical protein GLRG_11154 [Colletotrichum graminicola M1.001]